MKLIRARKDIDRQIVTDIDRPKRDKHTDRSLQTDRQTDRHRVDRPKRGRVTERGRETVVYRQTDRRT